MANYWAVDLDSILYTRISGELKTRIGKSYPDMLITSTDRTPQVAQFPTIYLHSLSGVEKGNTTEGKTINAVLYTLQAEVTTTETKEEALNIMAELVDIVKAMGFEVVAMPEVTSTEDTFRAVARFRRTICSTDMW